MSTFQFLHVHHGHDQGPVIQRVDNFIRWINGLLIVQSKLRMQQFYPLDLLGIYPLDKVIHSSYNRALCQNDFQHTLNVQD